MRTPYAYIAAGAAGLKVVDINNRTQFSLFQTAILSLAKYLKAIIH